MALINCPNCNGVISDKADFCPHCGGKSLKFYEEQMSFQKRRRDRWCVIGIIIMFVILLIGLLGFIVPKPQR